MITATLDKLDKDDLIKVIANINVIVNWDLHGLSEIDQDFFKKIGGACEEHCKQTDDWELPKV